CRAAQQYAGRGNGRTFPSLKSPSATRFLLVQEHASRLTAGLSVGILLLTKRRSPANPCQLRRARVPLFTLARLITREHSRFAWNTSVAIRRLARSSRQSNGLRSHVPRFKESRTDFQAISCTSRWLPPLSPSCSRTTRARPSRL